jgi:hypothetical protein
MIPTLPKATRLNQLSGALNLGVRHHDHLPCECKLCFQNGEAAEEIGCGQVKRWVRKAARMCIASFRTSSPGREIRYVDAAGGANWGFGAGDGPFLGIWGTVLWYQGRSRVVPEWSRGGMGLEGAILSIANAYATQWQATPMRPLKPGVSQGIGKCSVGVRQESCRVSPALPRRLWPVHGVADEPLPRA